jgi:hypothetical protein
MTRQEFARQASWLAKLAADWAGDTLSYLPEELNQPVNPDAIQRFKQAVNDRLSFITVNKDQI